MRIYFLYLFGWGGVCIVFTPKAVISHTSVNQDALNDSEQPVVPSLTQSSFKGLFEGK